MSDDVDREAAPGREAQRARDAPREVPDRPGELVLEVHLAIDEAQRLMMSSRGSIQSVSYHHE